jgi:hypothetical protein
VGKALCDAESHRIVNHRHDYRNGAGHSLHGAERGRAIGNDHIRFKSGELSRERCEPFVVAIRPADLDPNVLPFHIAEFAESATENIDPLVIDGSHRSEKTDERHRPLLCACQQRPRDRRAGGQLDEVSPLHGRAFRSGGE